MTTLRKYLAFSLLLLLAASSAACERANASPSPPVLPTEYSVLDKWPVESIQLTTTIDEPPPAVSTSIPVALGFVRPTQTPRPEQRYTSETEFNPDSNPRPDIWLNADGEPASDRKISSSPGPGHCDLESIHIMSITLPLGSEAGNGGRRTQFVNDPLGVLDDWGRLTIGEFEIGIRLPTDATFTGWTNDNAKLWISQSNLNNGVYMVTGSTIEKWPRVEPRILCY